MWNFNLTSPCIPSSVMPSGKFLFNFMVYFSPHLIMKVYLRICWNHSSTFRDWKLCVRGIHQCYLSFLQYLLIFLSAYSTNISCPELQLIQGNHFHSLLKHKTLILQSFIDTSNNDDDKVHWSLEYHNFSCLRTVISNLVKNK
jgi:hypothetical protein